MLPATTFLERTELSRGYGALVLQEARPVMPPAGSAPNHEVFAELCRRAGVARPGDPETTEQLARRDASVEPVGRRAPWQALDAGRRGPPGRGPAPVQFVDAFPRTADRKVHLFPEELDREAPAGLYGFRDDPATAQFPLALISPGDRPDDQLDARASSRGGRSRSRSTRTTRRRAASPTVLPSASSIAAARSGAPRK